MSVDRDFQANENIRQIVHTIFKHCTEKIEEYVGDGEGSEIKNLKIITVATRGYDGGCM